MGHFSCLAFSSLKIVLGKGDCLASHHFLYFSRWGGPVVAWAWHCEIGLAQKRRLATILYQNPLGQMYFRIQDFLGFREVGWHGYGV